ncbi:gamma-aminobutyric acid type B receptor subunit 1-like [Saccoglossus kowalevskii]|uniref:Gamma-aminobutyric acid type B receptor subunit 1-like n=1 Tax=Saccoglossus kowalevskii TaxID=10224 RepID=A0ABM0GSZ1_SACKO|nr:PREDICTED: gamma-aminobutyric acid type B receptor subunit 1-like [Saccoglossus kowalevskii]
MAQRAVYIVYAISMIFNAGKVVGQTTPEIDSHIITLMTTDGVSITTKMTSPDNLLQEDLSTGFRTSLSPASTMSPHEQDVDNKQLNIVGFFPLSGNVWRATGVLPACELAIEHVNANDDTLSGYTLRMDYGDTQCNPGYGTKVLFEFINSNITYVMLLGAGCSGVAQPVSMGANLWNLVQMSYSASNPALSNTIRYPSFYRTYAPDSLYNNARLAMIKYYGWRKVATLHENQELFSSTINHLSSLLRDNDIDILTSESFTVDASEQVRNLKEKNARIIFGNFYEDMARQVFCEVYKQNMYGKHYAWIILGWYSHDWWKVADPNIDCTPEQLYTALDGYIATENIDLSIYRDRKTVSGYTPNEFQLLYEDVLKERNIYDSVNAGASYCYDAVWSIALTLNQSIDILQNDANTTNRRLEDFHYEDNSMRKVFMDVLENLNFEGVSGPVSFNPSGDREGLVNIEQLQDGKEVVVGVYFPQVESLDEQLRWDMGDKAVQWKGGEPPKDETDVIMEYQRIPKLYVTIFSLLTGVGVLLSGGLLVFTIVYWRRTCIYKAAPVFLVAMISGIILLYVSIILLGLDANIVGQNHLSLVCTIRAWTLSVGFTLSYGSIFSKVYRCHKLFTTKVNLWKPGPHTVPILRYLMVFLILDLVTLIVWSWKFPMELTIDSLTPLIDEDKNVEVIPLIEYCTKGNSMYFIAALMIFHGLQLLLGAFLSYETRDIKIRTLNDIFFNGVATYVIVTLSIICAPLSFIIYKPDVAYLIVASLVWTACTLTLLFIYIPKIIYVWGTCKVRRNSISKTDEQLYEEEVDEETKLRHKLEEVDQEIDLVKKEIERRKKFGRYATMSGCGIWCFGRHFGCTCCDKGNSYEVDCEQTDKELRGYFNPALDVSTTNIPDDVQTDSVPSTSQITLPLTDKLIHGEESTNDVTKTKDDTSEHARTVDNSTEKADI